MTRRRWAPALVMAFAVCLGGCGFHGISLQSLPKLGGVTSATYPIHATFANVLNLPVEGQVRVGPQVVGEVTSISASDFQASVTMRIEKSVTLLQGTTAQVRFDNPLGDEYVLLTAPADTQAPPLRPGAQIPESDTGTAPSVEDTLGALSLVLNGGGINQLQTIIHELNNTFHRQPAADPLLPWNRERGRLQPRKRADGVGRLPVVGRQPDAGSSTAPAEPGPTRSARGSRRSRRR